MRLGDLHISDLEDGNLRGRVDLLGVWGMEALLSATALAQAGGPVASSKERTPTRLVLEVDLDVVEFGSSLSES